LIDDYQQELARLTRERTEAVRKLMNKCPREIIDIPTRCLSTPPTTPFKSPTSVPAHRLRAWFHSRGQSQNGNEQQKDAMCLEDEHRFMTFVNCVGLELNEQHLDRQIGIDDSNKSLLPPTRASSLPSFESLLTLAPPLVQQLRTWYHMSHEHSFASNGTMSPPVQLAEERAFVRFAFSLGLDIADLEDMDLPITLQQTDPAAVNKSRCLSPGGDYASRDAPDIPFSKQPNTTFVEISTNISHSDSGFGGPETQQDGTPRRGNTDSKCAKRLLEVESVRTQSLFNNTN
jgi:hypothetical protein